MDYPIWNTVFGGGVLIGVIAIAHVLVSHFAVGGGIVIAISQTIALRRNDGPLLALVRRSSLMLILVSTVFGAISGVGIWVVIGLVQPAATSALIHTFVWGWAIEWAFFILEVVTALAYFATWDKVKPHTHLILIWLYAFAAFMSLVIIQGILAFMLTPGQWVETRSFWHGFFNPTYLPGLVLRTGICLLLAGAYLTLAAMREKNGQARAKLVRFLAIFQVLGALLAYGGYRWWESALPGSIQAIFTGAAPLLGALATTRHFVLWALTAFLALVIVALGAPKLLRWPVAVVTLLVAFAFFAGYERLREGVRKPFVVRDYMFSNGVLVSEIDTLNHTGVLAKAHWAAVGVPLTTQEGKGLAVFRAQCASCHTVDGYLSIRRLVESPQIDADMLAGILGTLKAQGDAFMGPHSQGEVVATEKLDYPLMPPFVGTDGEMEALKTYLLSLKATSGETSHDK